MIRYKLVTQDFKTRAGEANETVWAVGVRHYAKGNGGLCTDGVIHSYETPLLAVLLNPIHADIKTPRLIEIECSDLISDDGLKGGHKSAEMIKEIPLPKLTLKQRVKFAINCVLAIPGREPIPAWDGWAANWKGGKADTATKAAESAPDEIESKHRAMALNAWKAAKGGGRAAYYAAAAAAAAARAAYAAYVDYAADAAAYAAEAAVWAADAARATKQKIDFAAIADEVCA